LLTRPFLHRQRLDAFFKSTKPPKAAAVTDPSADDHGDKNKKQKTAVVAPSSSPGPNTVDTATMRTNANRNLALAKQAVIACEKTGSVPALADLLIDPSWKGALGEEMNKPYFKALERFVQSAWNSSMVFPPKDCVFRAYNAVPLDQVKVVILGQVRDVLLSTLIVGIRSLTRRNSLCAPPRTPTTTSARRTA
jgi:hypothetical protein